jgi:hypothetical protein
MPAVINRRFLKLVPPGALFVITFLIFLRSEVRQINDSGYSMLLSQSLIDNRSFTLDAYNIQRREPRPQKGYVSNGEIYQIELVNGHLYYFFPAGSSILSVPFVVALNWLGISAANPDGTYNGVGETLIEIALASALMAGLTVVIFYTASQILSFWWSVMVAAASALGTQIYSTASRGLWSDTWGIFILGIVIFLLTRAAVKQVHPPPILLATLLAWLYFVRPTFCIAVIAVSVYFFVYHRPAFIRFAIAGAFWLTVFVGYSRWHYQSLLPSYYRAGRLSFETFWMALAGNLISPARGLLIFVPVLSFVFYLLIRYRRHLAFKRLVALSLPVIAAHVIVVSGFVPWYGGHSFGPRYTTGLVPWFSLLAILGIKARVTSGATDVSWLRRLEAFAGIVLLLASVAINYAGATKPRTAIWNLHPVNIDDQPSRIWDWKHPQFLG